MEKNLKILLITGLHGSELYGDIVVKKLIKNFSIEGIEIDSIGPINTNMKRNVDFNLNRIDEINDLFAKAKQMKKLLAKTKEYDIILDIHNTEACMNCLLHSSQTDRNYLLPDMVPIPFEILWRKSKFDTVSEYLRKQGKISYTVEINSNVFIDHGKLDRDVDFLKYVIKFSILQTNHDCLTEKLMFTPYNKLRVIKLNKRRWYTEKDFFYPQDILTVDGKPFDEVCLEEKLNVKRIKAIAVDGNYSDTFEGILLEL